MYPSDYAYTFANGVDDTCYTNTYNCSTAGPNYSWLYKYRTDQWTVSPSSSSPHSVFRVSGDGSVTFYSGTYNGLRPVVYLKSGIKLQGSGTSSEPYEIIG